MIDEGITFPVACDISSLDTLTEKHPVFATNLKNYKKRDLEKLSRYEGIIVAMGYEDELLGKTPSLTITVKETGLCSRIYNLKKSYEKITLIESHTVDLSPYDDKGGLWTSPLKFTDEDREIFAKTAFVLAEESEEVILPVNGVRSYIYKISQNNFRVYLYNDDDFFKVEKIKLPISIKHAKSLIKSENLKGFTSDEITVKLMNCKVEIVEIEEK